MEETAFWTADLQSLNFVSVPECQDAIVVAGCVTLEIASPSAVCSRVPCKFSRLCEVITMDRYPLGGDSLSITRGIVSRVVLTRYAHASNKLLGVQIDAAINPVSWLRSIAELSGMAQRPSLHVDGLCAIMCMGLHWCRRLHAINLIASYLAQVVGGACREIAAAPPLPTWTRGLCQVRLGVRNQLSARRAPD